MTKIIRKFMDANGKEVPEEQAERTIIAEYDDDGNRIKGFYLSNTPPMTPEEAKAYWDSIVVDPNSELIKKARSTPVQKNRSIEEIYNDYVKKRK